MPLDLKSSSNISNTEQEHERKKREIAEYFANKDKEVERKKLMLEDPEGMMIEEHSKDVLLHWQGPEFEVYEKDSRWYLIATLILTAIVTYAVITNNPIMAITFILIGIVGYIFLQKDPRVLTFSITHDGIVVGNEIYEYKSIQSFWIHYEPPHTKILSLHSEGKLMPYIHIPIHQEDPVKIREVLMKFVPEIEQEQSLIDTIERLLHI